MDLQTQAIYLGATGDISEAKKFLSDNPKYTDTLGEMMLKVASQNNDSIFIQSVGPVLSKDNLVSAVYPALLNGNKDIITLLQSMGLPSEIEEEEQTVIKEAILKGNMDTVLVRFKPMLQQENKLNLTTVIDLLLVYSAIEGKDTYNKVSLFLDGNGITFETPNVKRRALELSLKECIEKGIDNNITYFAERALNIMLDAPYINWKALKYISNTYTIDRKTLSSFLRDYLVRSKDNGDIKADVIATLVKKGATL